MKDKLFKAIAFLGVLATGSAIHASAQAYKVTNLLSDGSVPATTTDANFINRWGMSASGNWWISTAGSGFNYVVPAAGTVAFKVIVPAASGGATATGLPAGSVTTAERSACSSPSAPRLPLSSPRSMAHSPAGTASSAPRFTSLPILFARKS